MIRYRVKYSTIYFNVGKSPSKLVTLYLKLEKHTLRIKYHFDFTADTEKITRLPKYIETEKLTEETTGFV